MNESKLEKYKVDLKLLSLSELEKALSQYKTIGSLKISQKRKKDDEELENKIVEREAMKLYPENITLISDEGLARMKKKLKAQKRFVRNTVINTSGENKRYDEILKLLRQYSPDEYASSEAESLFFQKFRPYSDTEAIVSNPNAFQLNLSEEAQLRNMFNRVMENGLQTLDQLQSRISYLTSSIESLHSLEMNNLASHNAHSNELIQFKRNLDSQLGEFNIDLRNQLRELTNSPSGSSMTTLALLRQINNNQIILNNDLLSTLIRISEQPIQLAPETIRELRIQAIEAAQTSQALVPQSNIITSNLSTLLREFIDAFNNNQISQNNLDKQLAQFMSIPREFLAGELRSELERIINESGFAQRTQREYQLHESWAEMFRSFYREQMDRFTNFERMIQNGQNDMRDEMLAINRQLANLQNIDEYRRLMGEFAAQLENRNMAALRGIEEQLRIAAPPPGPLAIEASPNLPPQNQSSLVPMNEEEDLVKNKIDDLNLLVRQLFAKSDDASRQFLNQIQEQIVRENNRTREQANILEEIAREERLAILNEASVARKELIAFEAQQMRLRVNSNVSVQINQLVGVPKDKIEQYNKSIVRAHMDKIENLRFSFFNSINRIIETYLGDPLYEAGDVRTIFDNLINEYRFMLADQEQTIDNVDAEFDRNFEEIISQQFINIENLLNATTGLPNLLERVGLEGQRERLQTLANLYQIDTQANVENVPTTLNAPVQQHSILVSPAQASITDATRMLPEINPSAGYQAPTPQISSEPVPALLPLPQSGNITNASSTGVVALDYRVSPLPNVVPPQGESNEPDQAQIPSTSKTSSDILPNVQPIENPEEVENLQAMDSNDRINDLKNKPKLKDTAYLNNLLALSKAIDSMPSNEINSKIKLIRQWLDRYRQANISSSYLKETASRYRNLQKVASVTQTNVPAATSLPSFEPPEVQPESIEMSEVENNPSSTSQEEMNQDENGGEEERGSGADVLNKKGYGNEPIKSHIERSKNLLKSNIPLLKQLKENVSKNKKLNMMEKDFDDSKLRNAYYYSNQASKISSATASGIQKSKPKKLTCALCNEDRDLSSIFHKTKCNEIAHKDCFIGRGMTLGRKLFKTQQYKDIVPNSTDPEIKELYNNHRAGVIYEKYANEFNESNWDRFIQSSPYSETTINNIIKVALKGPAFFGAFTTELKKHYTILLGFLANVLDDEDEEIPDWLIFNLEYGALKWLSSSTHSSPTSTLPSQNIYTDFSQLFKHLQSNPAFVRSLTFTK